MNLWMIRTAFEWGGMMKRLGLAWSVCVALSWLLSAAAAGAAEETAAARGRDLFLANCSPCHGASGRGDGPSATLFLTAPRNLREGFIKKYSSDALVAKVLDGRPLPLALDIPSLRRHSKETAAIEQHLRRLPQLDWPAVEDGWTLYARRCAACHGPFGKPNESPPAGVRPPRDLASREFQASVGDAALVEAVRHGRGGMPALVPRLRIDQAKKLAAFVRVLGPGFESYTKFCGQCHGDDGVGVGNFDETVGAPAVVFDADYFRRVPAPKVRESIWHMLRSEKPTMPHFRNVLKKSEAQMIVDYLKALPKIEEK